MSPIGQGGHHQTTRKDRAIDSLSPAKRELLERMLERGGAADCHQALQIPVRQRDQTLLLSSAQERIWLWQQIHPDSVAHHIRSNHRIVGSLDRDVLAQSLSEIVRRHEILRTTYHFGRDDPLQRVEQPKTVSIPLSDLSDIPETERNAEIARILRRESRDPFDLQTGPPLRCHLVKIAEDEHIFTVVLHHIACDGWSLVVLLRELSRLYAAFASGHPSPLLELPLQFADFAQWQRAALAGDALSRQRRYWMKQLAAAPPLVGFPTDFPRPAMQSFNGMRDEILLPRALVDELSENARREAATLFMTMLAAFQALLLRETGEEDIVVGSPVAGRDRVETENLIGCFINMVVMRADLSGDPTFRELLQRVRELTIDAFTHQAFPFERLLEELPTKRNSSFSPLFQVLFALENLPRPCLSLPGMQTVRIDSESGTAQYDVSVTLRSRDDGALRVVVEYNTDLFRPATIVRILETYRRLLEGVASNPNRRITELLKG